ncbi:MAG: DUF4199 domain-containing protein, partial [Bacteroidota bacterium]|nr:DUF4199 domain-containing protein [Bacteroidota bacterium]
LEIGQISGYFSNLIPIIFIYIALHEFQEATSQKLSYIDGINIGFRATFIFSALLVFFLYVYNTTINPHWIEALVDWQRKKIIMNGASDDEISRFITQHRQMNSSPAQALMGFISYTALGVVITLIEIPIVKLRWKKTM